MPRSKTKQSLREQVRFITAMKRFIWDSAWEFDERLQRLGVTRSKEREYNGN